MSNNYLSGRQLEILQLAANGFGYAGIADQLDISKRTVENTMREICLRLDARGKTHAVTIALGRGLISSLFNPVNNPVITGVKGGAV